VEDPDSNLKIRERSLDARILSDSVLRVCNSLLDLMQANAAIGDELAAGFEPALADIAAVEIAEIDATCGSFTVSGGTLTLSENDVARMIAYVLSDMRQQIEDGGPSISESSIQETLQEIVILFALHELRHRTQGVGSYARVQALKEITGPDEIARFDIQADRDAAIALAAYEAGSLESSEFLECYQRALFYSVQYFFKIYPANRDRLDKTCRIAALLLMLARLQIYRAVGSSDYRSATAPLLVNISKDKRAMAVMENGRNRRLIGVSSVNDTNNVPMFIKQIENGDLEQALGTAFVLSVSLGLISPE
jgi:hypothetical protein